MHTVTRQSNRNGTLSPSPLELTSQCSLPQLLDMELQDLMFALSRFPVFPFLSIPLHPSIGMGMFTMWYYMLEVFNFLCNPYKGSQFSLSLKGDFGLLTKILLKTKSS